MSASSNFEFIPDAWTALYDAALAAEASASSDAEATARHARRALDWAMDIHNREPLTSLEAALPPGRFRNGSARPPDIVQQWMDRIEAADDASAATPADAEALLEALHKFLWWFVSQYDPDIGPRTPIDWILVERRASTVSRSLTSRREKPPESSSTSAVPSAAPEDTAPEEAVPEGTAPEDTAPEDTAPEDTAPEDTAPEDTAPEEAVPEDTAPEAPTADASEPPAPKGSAPGDFMPNLFGPSAPPDAPAAPDAPDAPAMPAPAPSDATPEASLQALRSPRTSDADLHASAARLLDHIADFNHALLRSFDAR
jgi:hypothetical protein